MVDPRALFGLAPLEGPGRARGLLLLVEGARQSGALLVDAVVGLTSLDRDRALPLPAVFRGAERRWFPGLLPLDGRIVVLPDVDGLLGGREGTAQAAPG